MTDRFDLEQQILECWNITKDLDDVRQVKEEGSEEITVSEMHMRLIGLKIMYEMRFNKLWNTFGEMVKEGKFK